MQVARTHGPSSSPANQSGASSKKRSTPRKDKYGNIELGFAAQIFKATQFAVGIGVFGLGILALIDSTGVARSVGAGAYVPHFNLSVGLGPIRDWGMTQWGLIGAVVLLLINAGDNIGLNPTHALSRRTASLRMALFVLTLAYLGVSWFGPSRLRNFTGGVDVSMSSVQQSLYGLQRTFEAKIGRSWVGATSLESTKIGGVQN